MRSLNLIPADSQSSDKNEHQANFISFSTPLPSTTDFILPPNQPSPPDDSQPAKLHSTITQQQTGTLKPWVTRSHQGHVATGISFFIPTCYIQVRNSDSRVKGSTSNWNLGISTSQ